MINSFKSGEDQWTHWIRVPDHRRDEFHNWLAASIPDTIAYLQHSEPHNGVKHVVYRITIKNPAHNTLLMLTWG